MQPHAAREPTERLKALLSKMRQDSGMLLVEKQKCCTASDATSETASQTDFTSLEHKPFDIEVRALPFDIGAKFTPTERILLTANGNLQRIISSWYNLPVSVNVLKNELVSDASSLDSTNNRAEYHRKVTLAVNGTQFAEAQSVVTLTDPVLITAVASNKVGLGQLFKVYNRRPAFSLIEARRATLEEAKRVPTCEETIECGIYRRYLLVAPGVQCDIVEVMLSNVLELEIGTTRLTNETNEPLCATNQTKATRSETSEKDQTEELANQIVISKANGIVQAKQAPADLAQKTAKLSHFGDISGTKTFMFVPGDDLFPLERVMLTANGQLARMFSSLVNAPVAVAVTNCTTESELNSKANDQFSWNTSQRYSYVNEQGVDVVLATSTTKIHVSDLMLKQAVVNGDATLGEDLFRYLNVLPAFSLVDGTVRRMPSNDCDEITRLERMYSLSSPEASLEVQETIMIHELWTAIQV